MRSKLMKHSCVPCYQNELQEKKKKMKPLWPTNCHLVLQASSRACFFKKISKPHSSECEVLLFKTQTICFLKWIYDPFRHWNCFIEHPFNVLMCHMIQPHFYGPLILVHCFPKYSILQDDNSSDHIITVPNLSLTNRMEQKLDSPLNTPVPLPTSLWETKFKQDKDMQN